MISGEKAIVYLQLLRCIIVDITNLFKLRPQMDSIEAKVVKDSRDVGQADEGIWKPWQHIWPKEKSKTGIYPVYNPSGKYVVKVYWLVRICFESQMYCQKREWRGFKF